MADPYLSISAFQDEYQGTLTAGEVTTTTRLLRVASDRIRALNPDADDDAATQVVFEIVRDAAKYGDIERLSEFQNTTSRRTEAGKFLDESLRVVDGYLTANHKALLGIFTRPAYYFGD